MNYIICYKPIWDVELDNIIEHELKRFLDSKMCREELFHNCKLINHIWSDDCTLSKNEKISYIGKINNQHIVDQNREIVRIGYEELRLKGIIPSVRKLITQTGLSSLTVQKYYKEFK